MFVALWLGGSVFLPAIMKRRKFLQLAGLAAAAASGTFAAAARLASPLRVLAGAGTGRAKKVLCLGLDGMDPLLLEQYMAEGALPHFAGLRDRGGFRVCATSTPPQSPVAWSSFITGQDPGGHGIFDFVHRDPKTFIPMLSISRASPPDRFFRFGGWKIPRSSGGGVELLRRGKAFWQYLADAGIDTTVFKMPSNFPPVDDRVRSISGMGTPDILGTYGVFGYYTTHPPGDTDIGGGRVVPVRIRNGRFASDITGPPNLFREGDPESVARFDVEVDTGNSAAVFRTGDARFLLQEGEWSDWVTVKFELIPHLKSVSGICRFYLMEVDPDFRLYVSPVQIDPCDPAMPICTPPGYARELAEKTGPFYTQGLPDDTKALDEGIFGDADYISQADLVLEERMLQYCYELGRFRALDRGFLFFYFNSLDQNCHMFWRNMDPDSPMHSEAGGRFRDRIREMYVKMDGVLGQALEVAGDDTVVFAVSDHGFAPYHRSFHVNSWLLENGYLQLGRGTRREDVSFLSGVFWRRTRAYAFGINGLYLNVRDRERSGLVRRGEEREALLAELAERLEAVVDPLTGEHPIKHAAIAEKQYHGPYVDDGPDIILGYARGYRGSNESALGQISNEVFSDNTLKWSGDHCMAADEVPGILVCNRPIRKSDPSLLDMAPTFLNLFGIRKSADMRGNDIFA
jgi:predicted AlkP superfamily phosphohydrolase/phosphomutase